MKLLQLARPSEEDSDQPSSSKKIGLASTSATVTSSLPSLSTGGAPSDSKHAVGSNCESETELPVSDAHLGLVTGMYVLGTKSKYNRSVATP